MIVMTTPAALPRKSFRCSNELWAAGRAAAERNNEDLSEVLRRFISDYAMGRASSATGYRIEYRVTSKTNLGDAPVVVSGLSGGPDEVRKLYPSTRWTIEEYDVSPTRPLKRRR